MHAIRPYELGGPEVLRHEEVPDLEPGQGQVRVAVSASGVHHPDTSLRQGFTSAVHQPLKLPMTPGREVAGRVDAPGPRVDPSWSGRRVVAHLGRPVVGTPSRRSRRAGGCAGFRLLAGAVDGSRVPLADAVFPSSDASGAHRALESRQTRGKVVLKPGALR